MSDNQSSPNISHPIDEVMDAVRNDPVVYGIAQRLRWILKQEVEDEIDRKDAEIDRLKAELAEVRAQRDILLNALCGRSPSVAEAAAAYRTLIAVSDIPVTIEAIADALDAIAEHEAARAEGDKEVT